MKGSAFWQYYADGQIGPAGEGWASGLYGIRREDSTWSLIQNHASVMRGYLRSSLLVSSKLDSSCWFTLWIDMNSLKYSQDNHYTHCARCLEARLQIIVDHPRVWHHVCFDHDKTCMAKKIVAHQAANPSSSRPCTNALQVS